MGDAQLPREDVARPGTAAGDAASAWSPLEQRGDVGGEGGGAQRSGHGRGFGLVRQCQLQEGSMAQRRAGPQCATGTGGTLDVAPGVTARSQLSQRSVPQDGVQSVEAGEEWRGLPAGTRRRRGFGESGGSHPCWGSAAARAAGRALPVPGAALLSSGGRSPSRAAGAEGPWADCWGRR